MKGIESRDKFEIISEIEKGSKNITEIARDFQIPKSKLMGIVSKKGHHTTWRSQSQTHMSYMYIT